jgi:hypothetical protein
MQAVEDAQENPEDVESLADIPMKLSYFEDNGPPILTSGDHEVPSGPRGGWTAGEISVDNAYYQFSAAKNQIPQVEVVKQLSEFVDQYDTYGTQGKQQHIENLKKWLTLVKKEVGTSTGVNFDALADKVTLLGDAQTSKAQTKALKDLRATLSVEVKSLDKQLNDADKALQEALGVTGKDALNPLRKIEFEQMRAQIETARKMTVELRMKLIEVPKSRMQNVGDFFKGLKDTVKSWFKKSKPAPEGPTAVQIGDVNTAIDTANQRLMLNRSEGTQWLDTGKEFSSVAEQAAGTQMLEAQVKALSHSIADITEVKSQLDAWGAQQDDSVMTKLDTLINTLAGKVQMYDANYKEAFQVDLYRLKIEVGEKEQDVTISQLTDATQTFFDAVQKSGTIVDVADLEKQAQTLATGIEQLRAAGVHESNFQSSVELQDKINTYIEQRQDKFATDVLTQVSAAEKNTDPDAQLLSLALLEGSLPHPDHIEGTVLESLVNDAYDHVYKAAGYDPVKKNLFAIQKDMGAAYEKYTTAQKLPKELEAFAHTYLTTQHEVTANQAELSERLDNESKLKTLLGEYEKANTVYQKEYKKYHKNWIGGDKEKLDTLDAARSNAAAELRVQVLDMTVSTVETRDGVERKVFKSLRVKSGTDSVLTVDSELYTQKTAELTTQATALVRQQSKDLQAQSAKLNATLADLPTLTADSPGAKQVNAVRADLERYRISGIVN